MIARRLLPAFLIALLMSGLFTWWLGKRLSKPSVAKGVAMRHLVAVSKDMDAGEPLQSSSLRMIDWPASQPLSGAFQKPADVAGRVLLFPVTAGEVVLDGQLAAAGAGNGLTAKIPEGMRAISLHSDEIAGVAGFLVPGSLVDVLATTHSANATDMITSTVLQDVRVLATGQKTEPDPEGKPATADAVTLLVSPQDAEKLTLASSFGKILFVLRNGADRSIIPGLSPQQVSLGAAPSSPVPAAPQAARRTAAASAGDRFTVQTILGSKQSDESFPEASQQ